MILLFIIIMLHISNMLLKQHMNVNYTLIKQNKELSDERQKFNMDVFEKQLELDKEILRLIKP